MTFLLTNDDGIDAPGIQALFNALDQRGVWVAPTLQHSGCGHRVTTDVPITVEKRNRDRYAVHGTPADCTRLGLTHFYPETEWVIAGINAGGNLGIDMYLSGTVAAVREAAILGKKAIAISHWINRPLTIDWAWASRWSAIVLEVLWQKPLPPQHFWNVNLPHLTPDDPDPELIFCEPSRDPLLVEFKVEGSSFHYQGEYSQRPRQPGSDVDVCFGGNIAITQLSI
ncbi:MAG: 5'/3'-nucleotidase SurE [Synechocystis sp.]|nr:5'/3'-nucleotidase SurE [Synechocystis sp.]